MKRLRFEFAQNDGGDHGVEWIRPAAVDAKPPPEAALHPPAAAARVEPADGLRCGA